MYVIIHHICIYMIYVIIICLEKSIPYVCWKFLLHIAWKCTIRSSFRKFCNGFVFRTEFKVENKVQRCTQQKNEKIPTRFFRFFPFFLFFCWPHLCWPDMCKINHLDAGRSLKQVLILRAQARNKKIRKRSPYPCDSMCSILSSTFLFWFKV